MTSGHDTPSKDHLLLHPSPDYAGSPDWGDIRKNRRRSTMHSYNLVNYHTLPDDVRTLTAVKNMTETKAIKNTLVVSVAFMFMFTAFVSLQSLQSTLHPDGLGLVSLSCIYGSTVFSCLIAPWLINKLTTKWTMVIAFVLFTGYVGANFHPTHYVLIPIGVGLGLLAGPLWSAQATYITTLAVTYAKHMQIDESEPVINKFMGIFCGFYRSSQIWGNLISALILRTNSTESVVDMYENISFSRHCGATNCDYNSDVDGTYNNGFTSFDIIIPETTKYMLLSIYLGCGIMGTVILVVLLDKTKIGKTEADPEFDLTSTEILISTLNMFRDPKCLLLIPLVLFVGLEQGFIFGDFTKSYVNCTLGIDNIGPLLVCFGAVSAVSSIVIGCIANHIKRFAFITAAAFFNVGILIVLWLWRPLPGDIPNFYVVAGCLGLCDAIWQTQTYTLFGVLFTHKQEAAFASYRMFHATGCAIAFGYSYFLCVETKVYILAAVLALALALYSVIEMKVQLQSQHMQDIVAL
ncbi:protein unc-93 homolog A [Patella vulgata]|uniref:protein unc-93 homolog A n=1 Tax=Patella vulgata TaxID=6465 RepID=UPI0021802D90|nr:protein unc-93 homolog A [Patella vulgata]XP_050408373.1 protein unc-93 homolog A [Patella vulgata]XP_050408374.1 protein unc-93 homolog A [Patella vulgata]